MAAIQESQWGQVIVYTWGDLSSHLWEDFRLSLMETETEQDVQGVSIYQTSTVAESLTEKEVHGVVVEFSPSVMESKTEMITSIVVSERDYKGDMIKYLPLYERKSGVFNEVLTAYDREFRGLEQSLEVVDRNILIDTAIESLPVYERDLGIQTVKSLRYDQRREQISSRNRASFDQTTEDTIKSVASAYSNGEVEVNKTSTVGVYEIKFVDTKGTPNNIDGLKKALDIVIPAHLGLAYAFTYNTWGMISDLTWGEVANMTWDELRTWDEVS
ncbi:putative phage tail protein [Peribacillus loiseleuriae]|uniref:putative phage tail protein n=1 Tax=Peribacillus loiseleuriae TaxID=1679170 RepID=UPI003D007957